MKILIHGINYSPELTGIGKYTGEMAEWLAARGHDVRVITAPPYYPWWHVQAPYRAWAYRKEVLKGVTVYRCPVWVPAMPTGAKRIIHLLSFAISTLPLSIRMMFWRPDVVFTVEPAIFAVVVAAATAKLCGAKSWLHVQDFELDAAVGLGMVGKGRSARYIARFERWLMQRFDRVSTISGAMMNMLHSKGVEPVKCRNFVNWVDTEQIKPLPTKQSLRDELAIPANTKVVLYSGNIGKKQGLEIVLSAAERLAASHPAVLFLIVGDGAARAELQESASVRNLQNIRFLPLQPVEKLPALLATADIHLVIQRRGAADVVMPSKLTGILAVGGTVVVTADPGTELYNVVTGNRLGTVITPESAEELSHGLLELLHNEERCRELGQNARHYAERELDKQAVLKEFDRQLHSLVGQE